MPKSSRNNEPAAWRLFIAHHLLARASKLKESAETDCVKDGVIFDKQKSPEEGGTKRTVYNGDVVTVVLEVRRASVRVDTDVLCDFLIAAKVPEKLVSAARLAASKPTKPAHV